jgi:hypothetical protein
MNKKFAEKTVEIFISLMLSLFILSIFSKLAQKILGAILAIIMTIYFLYIFSLVGWSVGITIIGLFKPKYAIKICDEKTSKFLDLLKSRSYWISISSLIIYFCFIYYMIGTFERYYCSDNKIITKIFIWIVLICATFYLGNKRIYRNSTKNIS